MERTIFLIFLCAAVEGEIGKHIFVPESRTWLEAQAYCREKFYDLSFVTSQSDQDKLLQAAGDKDAEGWIGLHRDLNNVNAWKWSGGGYVTYQNWAPGQPDNYDNKEYHGNIKDNGEWNDAPGTETLPFYCINVTVVWEKKTWEEAQMHCRKYPKHLISLVSESDCLLIKNVMRNPKITERVWTGLRYLEDRWLWVNGDPLLYKAWHQGGDQDHMCPMWKRCGAFSKEGLWENWDCRDKLNFICY